MEIKKINSKDSNIGDGNMQEVIAKLQEYNQPLYIDLSGHGITDTGASVLATFIENASNIIILDLSDNNIEIKGFNAIKNAIHNTNISIHVIMTGNNIGNKEKFITNDPSLKSKIENNNYNRTHPYQNITNTNISIYVIMTGNNIRNKKEFITNNSSLKLEIENNNKNQPHFSENITTKEQHIESKKNISSNELNPKEIKHTINKTDTYPDNSSIKFDSPNTFNSEQCFVIFKQKAVTICVGNTNIPVISSQESDSRTHPTGSFSPSPWTITTDSFDTEVCSEDLECTTQQNDYLSICLEEFASHQLMPCEDSLPQQIETSDFYFDILDFNYAFILPAIAGATFLALCGYYTVFKFCQHHPEVQLEGETGM